MARYGRNSGAVGEGCNHTHWQPSLDSCRDMPSTIEVGLGEAPLLTSSGLNPCALTASLLTITEPYLEPSLVHCVRSY